LPPPQQGVFLPGANFFSFPLHTVRLAASLLQNRLCALPFAARVQMGQTPTNHSIGRRAHMNEKEQAEQRDTVSSIVADTMTAMNLGSLSLAPAVAIDQTLFAQSQAQGVLFANMLTEQQNTFVTGHAAAIKATAEIYGIEEAALHFPDGKASIKHED
jgi:hypothetical protein